MDNKNAARRRAAKGAYAAASSALVLAVVIAVNLLLGQLPSGSLEFDLTGDGMYTPGAAATQLLSGLESDVEIIVLTRSGGLEERLQKFLDNYEKLSPYIKLTQLDPVADPTAIARYDAREDSVVVRSDATGKSSVIDIYGFEGYGEGLLLCDLQRFYTTGSRVPVALDAEGQLTGAVMFVSGVESERVYVLEGHSEQPLGVNISGLIAKANLAAEPLNILKEGHVPRECKLVVCNTPASDLADDELSLLGTYLRDGGDLLLVLDDTGFANWNSLLGQYGISPQPGFVGDRDRYYQNFAASFGYNCIYPVLSAESDITAGLTSDAIVIGAHPLILGEPLRRGAAVTAFMTTSDSGINIIDENTQTDGVFVIAASAIEELAGVDTASRLTVVAAATLIDDSVTAAVPGSSNLDIFMNAIAASYGGVSLVNIPARPFAITYNTLKNTGLWGVFFVGIVPLGFIVCGFAVWTRRRLR
ncbi:MAG: GldG family protein [Oscillospiraceae bacterium]|nr:GldG family protein [Oscillospiraceae bacterium]